MPFDIDREMERILTETPRVPTMPRLLNFLRQRRGPGGERYEAMRAWREAIRAWREGGRVGPPPHPPRITPPTFGAPAPIPPTPPRVTPPFRPEIPRPPAIPEMPSPRWTGMRIPELPAPKRAPRGLVYRKKPEKRFPFLGV